MHLSTGNNDLGHYTHGSHLSRSIRITGGKLKTKNKAKQTKQIDLHQ